MDSVDKCSLKELIKCKVEHTHTHTNPDDYKEGKAIHVNGHSFYSIALRSKKPESRAELLGQVATGPSRQVVGTSASRHLSYRSLAL